MYICMYVCCGADVFTYAYMTGYDGIQWISKCPPNVCLRHPFQVLTDAVAHGLPVWQHQSGKPPGVPNRFSLNMAHSKGWIYLLTSEIDQQTYSTNGYIKWYSFYAGYILLFIVQWSCKRTCGAGGLMKRRWLYFFFLITRCT